MSEKPKIMGMTDHSLKTGFGIVMHNILEGLAEFYDVYFLGWGFHYEDILLRGKYKLLPSGNHPFGEDVLPYYLQQINPEVLITQVDIRMVDWLPDMLKQLPNKPTWILYPVIDGHVWDLQNTQKKWAGNWVSIMKQADIVVGMTEFGQKILQVNGIDAKYIPHGVDSSFFKPFPEAQRAEIKKGIGAENKFIIGGIFKNIQRKNPEKYLQAYSIFRQGIEDKTILVLHTAPNRKAGGEMDLAQQASDLGLVIGKDVLFSNAVPPQYMSSVLNSFDVFWALGGMEGFCLPLLEAMACGVPVVAINGTTFPEILGGTGMLSDVPIYPDSHVCPVTYGSYNGIEGLLPNSFDIAKKTKILYENPKLREEMSFKESVRASSVYDWSIVRKQWIKLIKSCIVTEEQLPEEWKKILEQTK